MRLQKALWLAGSALTLCCTAEAQSTRRAPAASPVVAPTVARVVKQQSLAWKPAEAPPRPAFRVNASRNYKVGPLTVERQRTAFVSQVRVPLHSFLGGRVQMACLHQRMRTLSVHSAVAVSDAASAYRSRGNGLVQARSQNTWGGGVWFQFGGPRS